MNAQEAKKTYRRLYRLFEGVTPLKRDCGVLCGGACCRGDDRTGMLLFPGEETSLPIAEADGRRFVLCGGTCERADRPLSCRIFPFLPLLSADGRVRAAPDPRGAGLCPLVRHSGEVAFDPRFLRRVKRAGRLLVRDDACRAFLLELTREAEEVSAFAARLSPDG